MSDDDDAVFESLRARVRRGEYLDSRLGPPGTGGEGGLWRRVGQGPLQKVYFRGTPEYEQALASGELEPLPPLTPATQDAVRECEGLLGGALPPLLRRCYLELGNGGFGPGHGLFPLRDPGNADSVVEALKQKDTWPSAWQTGEKTLLPLCPWGCGIESLVDCADPSGPMWAIDPNPTPPGEEDVALFPQELTLAGWMRRWVEDTLQRPWLLQDEQTGQWRGATSAEYEPL
ncbi:hypothetical protein OUQ99_31395 (plasmid) [Streptomonospora nanhaiensis]|uniref:Knr4/Smi1-like domain-containing protein n=1 Tax=Streptomonospora nanhaiensis TaxID=1323731 RepID=A0ABY6YWX7_9ACTN|nr:SMI1/KNR4 family protein [Streptomonospora nanhaiensis]WAE76846.1 hypothetical protein OUQ99_31395 [Streptomonospora nanhaiensis]